MLTSIKGYLAYHDVIFFRYMSISKCVNYIIITLLINTFLIINIYKVQLFLLSHLAVTTPISRFAYIIQTIH